MLSLSHGQFSIEYSVSTDGVGYDSRIGDHFTFLHLFVPVAGGNGNRLSQHGAIGNMLQTKKTWLFQNSFYTNSCKILNFSNARLSATLW